jgi:hypothetical protein
MTEDLANVGMNALQGRWQAMFETLRDGGEVAPSLRLRIEGMMETLVILQLVQVDAVQASLASCYEQVFGESLSARWGEDWALLFPFPQLPVFGQRAPVYPSTPD